jgi:DNA mismatch endonuclease (patch repair protein)
LRAESRNWYSPIYPMDFLTKKKRSELMSRVRATGTKPELTVQRVVRGLGYRFRTYDRSLPGRPDLVFPSIRKVILVHGCFWHRHRACRKATMPKTRVAFWRSKFERNKHRDRIKLGELRRLGWRALTVWECETATSHAFRNRVRRYLETA